MPPLNPFLAAFFKSAVPTYCKPITHHVLLVPTTEVFLTHRDIEAPANATLAESVNNEEFLASHTLRIPDTTASGSQAGGGKDGVAQATPNLREMRGKARQYPTTNGRSVIIKDGVVYTNKGFKTLSSAALLGDAIWYSDTVDPKAWLIYYISQPLLGAWEEVKITPAILPGSVAAKSRSNEASSSKRKIRDADVRILPTKKEVKSFHDLLNHFPVISRQMHQGLEKLFQEFTTVMERPLPPPPSASHIPDPPPDGAIAAAVRTARSNSVHSSPSRKRRKSSDMSTEPFYAEDDEETMRASLETAVTSAIDLFQGVDKQQLSLLGATTELTGPLVERLLERYVSENVHNLVFPRLCAIKRQDDLELEAKIRQMEFIDVSQLGMDIEGGRAGKQALVRRLTKAVDEFKKIVAAPCPSKMMDVLLSTLKAVTSLEPDSNTISGASPSQEKSPMTMNADTLVSLLLYVVIRAQVKHLQARFVYIRHFIFLDDVDSGEMGYALSTFEAVLSYLDQDSSSLRRASRRNKTLWDATASGDMTKLREIMEATHKDPGDAESDRRSTRSRRSRRTSSISSRWSYTDGSSRRSSVALSNSERFSMGSDLTHVFPFAKDDEAGEPSPETFMPGKRIKRVTIDASSISSGSEISFRSRATSIGTFSSGLEGDTSVERLAQTQNSFGESLLMMAVQNERAEVLQYLLSLQGFFPPLVVIEDANNEGSTLLSAAVQLGHEEMIRVLLDYLTKTRDVGIEQLEDYFARQDTWGRSVGHYLFHAPALISTLGLMVSWRQKDKNGQTPLFAICRSYDHAMYSQMVEQAIEMARLAQKDNSPLHLDDHVDGKGNTLLHIVNDPHLILHILQGTDVDVNAANEKKFTPLMVASKYGRFDMVRVFYGDSRVDMSAKEARGLTAVELAKDDEIRNKIDDLTLFGCPVGADHRTTAVVRAYLVEDASVRFVIKSGAPVDKHSYAVTTCRRSLTDFEHLVKLLTMENPASWVPSLADLRTPFQIPGKPSRAVLKDLQVRMDWFLRILLSHTTFATHEMLWEFFLVPDLQTEQMEQRSRLKAKARAERIRDELQPLDDAREVEQFVDYAREMVRNTNHSTKSVARRGSAFADKSADLYDAGLLVHRVVSTLAFLPKQHITAIEDYTHNLQPTNSNPFHTFHSSFLAVQATIDAVLTALGRPPRILSQISASKRAVERETNTSSLSRSSRWAALGLLSADTDAQRQQRLLDEREEKARQGKIVSDDLSKELRDTQTVVASELAGWQDLHEKMGRRAIRELARGQVVAEKMRLEGMRRVLRRLREGNEEMERLRPAVPAKDGPSGSGLR